MTLRKLLPKTGSSKSGRIYFDYVASTPVETVVEKSMQPFFGKIFGNPGSLHSFGQEALTAVDHARELISKSIGTPPAGGFREVIFTGSATEANNLALRGSVRAIANKLKGKPRIIVSAIEHESIMETVKDLEKKGIEIIYLPVNREGLTDLGKLKTALNERTCLVSIMYANNQIGAIEPISEISKIIREFRKQIYSDHYPLFHTDAVQAFQFLDCQVQKLGIDLMTFSAHKIYGPKGIGALYIKNQISENNLLAPLISGGGEEFNFRSGTENVPLIVGFAKAVELVDKVRHREVKRLGKLRDYFWESLKNLYSPAEINGTTMGDRLPNILNVYFPEHLAEDLLVKFDLAGLAVSAGSACSSRSAQPAYVVQAIGYSRERAKRSLRFSFGRPTTRGEIDRALAIIKNIIK